MKRKSLRKGSTAIRVRRPLRVLRRVEDESSLEADRSSDSDYSNEDFKTESEYAVEMTEDDDLQSYLHSKLNNKGKSATKTMISRCANFFSWLSHRFKLSHCYYSLLHMLLMIEYTVLTSYYAHLEEVLLLSPATILTYNDDILFIIRWFVCFRIQKSFYVSASCLISVELVIKNLRKLYKKQQTLLDLAKPRTVAQMVAEHLWPVDGMQGLSNAVRSQITWVHEVIKGRIDKCTHGMFMELLCSAAYSESIQGRPKALDHLKMKDLSNLLESGGVMSSQFKTVGSFGLQPITTGKLFVYLLKIYLEYFRVSDNDPESLLLVSYDGSEIRVGRMVTRFFKRTLNLHVTTTTIRSMVETKAEELEAEGSISGAQRKSVLDVNGHSSATAKRFYLYKNREADIMHVSTVHSKMVAEHDEDDKDFDFTYAFNDEEDIECDIPVTVLAPAPAVDQVHTPSTGTLHPDYMSPTRKRRFTWSNEEMGFVGDWCDRHSHLPNVYASCLKVIKADSELIKIFAPNHIESSTRLRNGYDAYLQRKNKLAIATA